MLLRLVALDSNSKDGWYDWRASEIRNHPNGGLHASISAQSRAGANVSFEPASITRPSQSSIAMSASNLFALLNVFLQFAREMNGGAIQSIVFREPMRNFQKWIFHNGVNSLEWAQSPGYYITLFGDLSSIFLVGIAETKDDRTEELLERLYPRIISHVDNLTPVSIGRETKKILPSESEALLNILTESTAKELGLRPP